MQYVIGRQRWRPHSSTPHLCAAGTSEGIPFQAHISILSIPLPGSRHLLATPSHPQTHGMEYHCSWNMSGVDGINDINSCILHTVDLDKLDISYPTSVVGRGRTVRLVAVKEGYSARRVPHIQITGTHLWSSPLTYGQQLSPDSWHIFRPIMWGSVGIIRCIRLRLSAAVSHKGEADAEGCAFLL